jgi:multicomponent Na+:H+ antiporter subunit D
MISSLLNIAYLLPIPLKGFFGKAPGNPGPVEVKEAPLPCLIAIGITSLGCLLLFFFPDPVYDLLRLIAVR